MQVVIKLIREFLIKLQTDNKICHHTVDRLTEHMSNNRVRSDGLQRYKENYICIFSRKTLKLHFGNFISRLTYLQNIYCVITLIRSRGAKHIIIGYAKSHMHVNLK